MDRISASIDIAATTGRVWAALMDFAAYPAWNPFIRSISGPTTPGGRLLVSIHPPGRSAMSFKPTVLVCDPERELRWVGSVLVRGILDGEHAFQLSGQAPNACRFTQDERFTGFLVPLVFRGAVKTATQAGFDAMNQALKRWVELKAAQRP